MSRWLPLPLSSAADPRVAALSPTARCAWLALRVAHAQYGLGGVVPTLHASPIALPLAAPALLAGIDVADALAELARVELVEQQENGLRLVDWAPQVETAPCSSCRRRNPDPRHGRCPSCRSRDTDPSRRSRSADSAQTSDGRENRRKRKSDNGLASEGCDVAQTGRASGAEVPRPGPDSTRQYRQYPSHQTRAREAPAAPAGDPPAAEEPQTAAAPRGDPSSRDVRGIAGAWAVEMADRGIERMVPAIHATDVLRLLADVGRDPSHVRDPDALAADRREAAVRIIRWCESPERLARWCVVAVRRYHATNVAGYLRRAAERGDPGTLLAQAGQGERVLRREDEQALRGEYAADVAQIVAATTSMLEAEEPELRRQLREQLRVYLRAGNRDAARRTLLKLVGPRRDDLSLQRAIGDACDLETARELLAA